MYKIQINAMTPVPAAWSNDIVFVTATTTTTTTLHASAAPPSQHDDDSLFLPMSTAQPPKRDEGLDPLAYFFAVWGVVLVLVALAVVTLVANGTILTMFVLRKSLRKCKNIYIASLAAADMGIGMTMPVAALGQVESQWVLEGLSCRVYLTVRCWLLYVSLLSILLITVDRWWSIHYPFSYRVRQSKRMAACAVGMVWAASFTLNVLPVLLWEHFTDKDQVTGTDTVHFPEALLSPKASSSSSASSSHSSSHLNPDTFDSSSAFSSPTVPSLSQSSLLSVLTTMSTTVMSSDSEHRVPSHSGDFGQQPKYFHFSSHHATKTDRPYVRHFLNTEKRCEVPYTPSFSFVLTVSVVQYFFPLLALWILNSSLYIKITRRKSIKIRRSLSVNENFLLTFRKSSSESESSPNNNQDESFAFDLGIRSAEQRQRLLAVSRASTRRHTLAFPGTPSRGGPPTPGASFGSGGPGSVYFPSQARHNRRVSLQDALPGIGNMAAWAGAAPNLPRVTTCHRFQFGSSGGLSGSGGGLTPMSMYLQSGPRGSVCSRRKQSDDLVKEMLVRQDKKAARCLGLLVTVFTLCWLPHTVVAVLRAYDPDLVASWVRDLVFWVLLTNSAVNPFLYGLLNAEFRKILRGWFYFRRRTYKLRLKHALLYWSLPPQVESDPTKENNTMGMFASPIRE